MGERLEQPFLQKKEKALNITTHPNSAHLTHVRMATVNSRKCQVSARVWRNQNARALLVGL